MVTCGQAVEGSEQCRQLGKAAGAAGQREVRIMAMLLVTQDPGTQDGDIFPRSLDWHEADIVVNLAEFGLEPCPQGMLFNLLTAA